MTARISCSCRTRSTSARARTPPKVLVRPVDSRTHRSPGPVQGRRPATPGPATGPADVAVRRRSLATPGPGAAGAGFTEPNTPARPSGRTMRTSTRIMPKTRVPPAPTARSPSSEGSHLSTPWRIASKLMAPSSAPHGDSSPPRTTAASTSIDRSALNGRRVHVEQLVGVDRSGDAAEEGRAGEDAGLGPGDVDAAGRRRSLVAAQRPQRTAFPARLDVGDRPDARSQHETDQPELRLQREEVHTEQRQRGDAAEAAATSGDLEVADEDEEDLGQCERPHGQEVTPEAEDRLADEVGERRGDRRARHQGEAGRPALLHRQQTAAVGADAEPRRLGEGELPAQAGDEDQTRAPAAP